MRSAPALGVTRTRSVAPVWVGLANYANVLADPYFWTATLNTVIVVNAVVFGEDFGDAMTRMFERDVAASQTIDAQTWRRRPLWPRLQERAARLFERWW